MITASYLKSVGVELSGANHRSLYIPEGCAHGYLTLSDDVEMRYLASHRYAPEAAAGVCHNDPVLGIVWPGEILLLSEADRQWFPLERGLEIQPVAVATKREAP